MAGFEQVGNILVVFGDDIYTDNYRELTRRFLYSPDADLSPVRQGTHDFWITYAGSSLGGGEHCCEDMSLEPRPMRGLVRMGDLPATTTADDLRPHLHTILQEVGHQWLVPSDLKFETGDSRLLDMPTGVELTRRINDETPFAGDPILLGRGDKHWSAYFQADSSPFDGMYWRGLADEADYQVWTQAPFASPPTITPTGLDSLALIARYCDLDLTTMGVIDRNQAYRGADGQVRWIEPRLMVPGAYLAGLFVAFGHYDFIYFGFRNDHRALAVQRTGQSAQPTVDLGPDYQPLASPANGMALRVVRRGSRYFFQARYDNPLAGCAVALLRLFGQSVSARLGALAQRRMFEDLEPLPVQEGSSFARFNTVAALDVQEPPEAIGLIVRKWQAPHLVDAAFFPPQLKFGSDEITLATRPLVLVDPGTAFRTLPTDELRIDNPTGDAILRGDPLGRLHIITPFSVPTDGGLEHFSSDHFEHWSETDHAPKALVRAPDGDFAFGTSCKIHRTIFTPWAGGYAAGKTVWGKAQHLPASGAEVPERTQERWPPPPDNSYKMAFILVAANRSDISAEMLERADVTRRYWDRAFESATLGHRHSDSRLLSST